MAIRRTIVDWLFGYDFFLSYAHDDGRSYPEALARGLAAMGFEVFIDTKEYVAGTKLDDATRRRVRMSQYLVVIAGEAALRSTWVAREVELFEQTGRAPIVIEIDGALGCHHGASELADKLLAADSLRLAQELPLAEGAAPEQILRELARAFTATRRERKRLRFVSAITVVLAALGVAASIGWFVASQRRARAEAAEDQATTERNRALLAQQGAQGLGAALLSEVDGREYEALLLALEANAPALEAGRTPPADAQRGLMAALLATDRHRLLPHEAPVAVIAVAPDGQTVVTATTRGQVRRWDLATGRPLSAPQDHTGPVHSIRFSASGEGFVTTSDDATAQVHASSTGALLGILRGHEAAVMDADFVGEHQLLTVSLDGQAKLWSLADAREVHSFAIPNPKRVSSLHFMSAADKEPYATLAVAPGHRHAAISSAGGPTVLLDLERHRELASLETAWGGVAARAAEFSRDGTRLLTLDVDHDQVEVWSVPSGEMLALLPHQYNLAAATFTPDGTEVVVGRGAMQLERHTTLDGVIARFDVASGKIVESTELGGAAFDDLAISADGRQLLSVNYLAALRWDTRTLDPGELLDGHAGPLTRGVLSPDGSRAITGSEDRSARIWTNPDQRLFRRVQVHEDHIVSARLSGDRRRLIAIGDGRLTTVLDTATLATAHSARHWDDEGQTFGSRPWQSELTAAQTPDGSRLITTGSGRAVVWNTRAPEFTVISSDRRHFSRFVEVSPDGGRFALVWVGPSNERSHLSSATRGLVLPQGEEHELDVNYIDLSDHHPGVELWDAREPKRLAALPGHGETVHGVVYASDGRHLATYGADGQLRLFDADGQALQTYVGHSQAIIAAQFFPDDRALVSGAQDGTLRLWSLTEAEANAVVDLSNPVEALDVCGLLVVAGTIDGTLVIWDSDSQTLRHTIAAHTQPVNDVAFAPDGAWIVSACENGEVKVWSAETAELLAEPRDISGAERVSAALFADFNANGRGVVVARRDGSVTLYPIELDVLFAAGIERARHLPGFDVAWGE